eukprot:2246490-Pyramimonas_sp.AAC.1
MPPSSAPESASASMLGAEGCQHCANTKLFSLPITASSCAADRLRLFGPCGPIAPRERVYMPSKWTNRTQGEGIYAE